MTYTPLYITAIVVAILSAMLGAAIFAAGSLGLTGQQVAAIGVANTGLALLASFLPRVTRPPDDARKGLD